MARKQWYQRKQYHVEMPRTEIHPGNFIQVDRIDEATLLIRREWPSGETDRVRVSQNDRGEMQYELAKKKGREAQPFIGDPDWHAPYVRTCAIAGKSPSSIETYDDGTGQNFSGPREREKYYEDHGLALMTRAEQLNMHERTPPKMSQDVLRDRFMGDRPLAPEGATKTIDRLDLNQVPDLKQG